MDSTFLATTLAAAVVCGAAAAEPVGMASPGLGERERLLAAFEQLPTARLEAVFMECDRVSSARLMALDEGARCAIAWDTLLRRRFDGNVAALLAWWRAERERSRIVD